MHEYSQFAAIIKRLLVYRHQKHVQFEMTQDVIENKKDALDELEKSEAEAQRLESALSRPQTVNGVFGAAAEGGTTEEEVTSPTEAGPQRQSEPVPPAPTSRRRAAGGTGLLGALSHSLHSLMDVDPATARRSSISKTRESLSQLEDALQLSAQDLKYASSTIQADLDRFQRQKVADLREMAISIARMHRDWCKAVSLSKALRLIINACRIWKLGTK